MADSIGEVRGRVGADVSEFISAMQQSRASIEEVIKATLEMARADGVASSDLATLETHLRAQAAAGEQAAQGMHAATGGAANFTDAVRGLSGGVEGAASSLMNMIGSLGPVEAAFAATATALVGLTVSTGQYAEKIGNLAAETGMTTDEIQRLKFAAEVTGVSFQGVTNSIDIMERKIGDSSKAFEKFGFDLDHLRELSTKAAFDEIMAGLAGITDQSTRAAAEMAIFGRSGMKSIAPMIDSYRQLSDEAEHFGAVMDADALRTAQEFDDALDKIKIAAAGAGRELAVLMLHMAEAQKLNFDNFGLPTAAAGSLAVGAGSLAGGGGVAQDFGDVTVTTTQAEQWLAAQQQAAILQKEQEAAAKKAEAHIDRLIGKWTNYDRASNASYMKWIADPFDFKGAEAKASGPGGLGQTQLAGLKEEARIDAEMVHGEEAHRIALKAQEDLLDSIVQKERERVSAILDGADAAGQMVTDLGRIGNILEMLGAKSDSKGMKIIGDLQQEAAGAQELLQGMATGNVVQMAEGAIKGVLGQVNLIKHLFGGKDEAAKIAEDLGRDFGQSFSNATMKAIEDTEKSMGVDRGLAEKLNLDKLMGEMDSPAQAGEAINHLMEAYALGVGPAKQEVEQLGKAFAALKTAAEGGDVAAEGAMRDMVVRARELGIEVPGMKKAVMELLELSVKGFEEMQTGMGIGSNGEKGKLTSELAGANADIFGAIFQAMEAELGAVESAKKLQKSFDDLNKSLPDGAKLTGSAAEAAQIIALLKNEQFAGAATTASGAAKVIGGLNDTGNLSQKTIDAFSAQLTDSFEQAMKGAEATGLDKDSASKAALEAVLPELVALNKAKTMGAKLTPEEEKMLADAQKAGLLPLQDVATQSLGVQRAQLQVLNKIAGTSVDGGGGEEGTSSGNGSVGTPSGGANTGPTVSADSGFFAPALSQDTTIKAHKGERAEITPVGGVRAGEGGGVRLTQNLNMYGGIITSTEELDRMMANVLAQGGSRAAEAVKLLAWHA